MIYARRPKIESRINEVFKHASGVTDLWFQSEVAKYLCILMSGLLEEWCRDLVQSYSHKRAQPQIVIYITSRMDSFYNPNLEKILQLIRSFAPNIAENLEETIEPRLKDAVDSISNNRKQLAHGKDVGLTLNRAKDYFVRTKTLIEFIESKFK